MPDLKIISLKDGFRRCGIEHPAKPVIYPEGTFTKEQVKKLKAEPLLVVEEVEAPKDKGPKKDQDKGSGAGAAGAGDPPADGQGAGGDK